MSVSFVVGVVAQLTTTSLPAGAKGGISDTVVVAIISAVAMILVPIISAVAARGGRRLEDRPPRESASQQPPVDMPDEWHRIRRNAAPSRRVRGGDQRGRRLPLAAVVVFDLVSALPALSALLIVWAGLLSLGVITFQLGAAPWWFDVSAGVSAWVLFKRVFAERAPTRPVTFEHGALAVSTAVSLALSVISIGRPSPWTYVASLLFGLCTLAVFVVVHYLAIPRIVRFRVPMAAPIVVESNRQSFPRRTRIVLQLRRAARALVVVFALGVLGGVSFAAGQQSQWTITTTTLTTTIPTTTTTATVATITVPTATVPTATVPGTSTPATRPIDTHRVPRPPCARRVGEGADELSRQGAERVYDHDGAVALGCPQGPMRELPRAGRSTGSPDWAQQFDGGTIVASPLGWATALYQPEKDFLRAADGELDLSRLGGFPLERHDCLGVAQVHAVVAPSGFVVGILVRPLTSPNYLLVKWPLVKAWIERLIEHHEVLWPIGDPTASGAKIEQDFSDGNRLAESVAEPPETSRINADRLHSACEA